MRPFYAVQVTALLLAAIGLESYFQRTGADAESERSARAHPGIGSEDQSSERVPIQQRVAPAPPAIARAALPAAAPQHEPAPVEFAYASAMDEEDYEAGRILFEKEWSAGDGLGAPGFNAESCAQCHMDPVNGGAGGNEVNVIRLPDQAYVPGQFPGNNLTRLREIREQILAAQSADDHRAPIFDEVQTPSLLGLGLIDTISDEEILRRADPDDEDRNGIRGVASLVAVAGTEAREVGRFGWKAQMPRLADFVCLALAGETGLTAPDQGRGFGLAEDTDDVADPEIRQPEFDQLVFFLQHLPPPESRGSRDDYNFHTGEEVFLRIGCAECHVPALQGRDDLVELYSDLLLHEVALEPATRKKKKQKSRRDRNRGHTEPRGFRTPPLWGVGSTAPYMHDGTSATLRDAVLAHGGEATRAREQFEKVDDFEQGALVGFLKDL